MIYRHRRKNFSGEAVQFTEDGKNDALIASWLHMHPQRVKEVDAIAAHTVAGAVARAERGKGKRLGDWLLKTREGGVYISREADFESHYVPVANDPPPRPKDEFPKRKSHAD